MAKSVAAPARTRSPRMDADERRQQIIEVAQGLFSQRPYSQVSTTDIAEAVGIGRANLHYHFGTKRDLYLEVVKNFARLPPLPTAKRERGTLEEEAERLLDRWLDVVWEKRGNMITIFEAGPIINDPEIEATLEEGREMWAARLADVLDLPGGATPPARALIRSFQSMAEAAVDEWLRKKRLTRDEVLLLLTQSLIAVAQNVAPSVLAKKGPGRPRARRPRVS